MGYRATEPGERGLISEPLPLSAIPGHWPGFPGGLPGPVSRAPGPIGPTMPTSIFPTHTRVGDVVTITGPFGGLVQGQVRVRFHGTSWLSPQILGPAAASVVVPEGAENGLCEVEIDGRRVFGTNCIVDPSTKELPQKLAWSHKGHPVGNCLDMAPFGYGLDAKGHRVLLDAYGRPVPHEIDPATVDIYGRPLTPASTAPPLAIGPRSSPVGAIAEKDTLDLAMFGAIGVLGFGWVTGNNTLRNTGIAATLALMLLRWKMGD